ncbi:hypothetical protein SLEP1_g9718 [Rubroshorea leprosula]|uniref:PGG domain-containing protein n=1 Tax=Rubroshorea leprosula TaxID=152421 RepID=A0AAV5IH29_9ROSI|nr:hypothetical protein SLEP1_g9718 [Rubroshorea leprosula]
MLEIRLDQQLLYKVARGNISREHLEKELENVQDPIGRPLLDIVDQLSPGGNSLLHAAARSGRKDITEYLAEKFPHLIFQTNYAGDTVLHSAAKAGKAETIEVLLQFYTNPTSSLTDGFPLLRMKNLEGNTALHEVVIQYNFAANYDKRESYCAVIARMVSIDPQLAYIANKERKSPLCLVVETTDLKIVQCLLEYPLPVAADCQQLPEGKSPVHAAIKLKLKNNDMLSEMLHRRPKLIDSTNGNGRKALHCAASVGNMGAIEFLLRNYPQTINERDNDGHYALHVACESGYVKAFNKLFNQWPDTSEYLNNKCQNVLHIAAKNGRDYMVRHIVEDKKFGPQLVNAKDIEGNTPLHLAAMHGHSLVVGTLLLTGKCDSQILNQEGFTAYEVAKQRAGDPMDSETQMGQQNMQSNEQGNVQTKGQTNVQREDVSSKNTKRPDSTDSMMALSILFLLQLFKILCGRHQQHRMKRLRHEIKIKRANKDDIKDRINALIVVATLIAGIAFQAAVQMPENGDDKGKSSKTNNGLLTPAPAPALALTTFPPLTRFKHFIADQLDLTYSQIFTFFISLSMNLSILAAITLCWVQLLDVNFSAFFIWQASVLVGISLYSICIAFGFTMLIRIKEFGLNYTTVMIGLESLFILVLTMVTSPLFIPFGLKYLFVRGLYVAFFIGYFFVHRLLDCCLYRLQKA